MKVTPYNNGKIKIGNEVYLNKLVNPPYVERDDDMLELQSYLIQDPRILNKEYWYKRIYIAFLLFVLTIILMAHWYEDLEMKKVSIRTVENTIGLARSVANGTTKFPFMGYCADLMEKMLEEIKEARKAQEKWTHMN